MLRHLLPIVAVLTLGACAGVPPKPDSNRRIAATVPDTPFEAFEKVGKPMRPTAGFAHDQEGLSRMIQRLQDARRAYEAAQSFRAAQTRYRQRKCRQSPTGREVPIEDGKANPVTYCQRTYDVRVVPRDDGR